MRQFPLVSILETGAIVLLILWFILSVGGLLFVWKQPRLVQEFLTTLIPKPIITPFTIKGVGVIGDSQSDEYRADDNRGENYPSTTLNWVEILEKERNINFGKWDTYDEPRRTGYEYNWARSGATTNSMIASGQHTGLAQQVKMGKVNLVIIFIGSNDYAPYITTDGYETIYNEELSEAELIYKRNSIVSNIKTAIDTIQASGNPKIVLVKISDWGNNLGMQVAFPLPQNRQRVTDAISDTNNELEKLASQYGLVTIDPNAFYKDVTQKQQKGKLVVGGVVMEKLVLNNDPKNMFVSDGIHPGTILNGLFVNKLTEVLNMNYGMNIKPLSEQEIITIAGL